MTDFTVKLSNMPIDQKFDGQENVLKAQLWK
jgi:hypothetical protein